MESESVLTKQQRIAENARCHPQVSFTSLAYHMDVAWLREAVVGMVNDPPVDSLRHELL